MQALGARSSLGAPLTFSTAQHSTRPGIRGVLLGGRYQRTAAPSLTVRAVPDAAVGNVAMSLLAEPMQSGGTTLFGVFVLMGLSTAYNEYSGLFNMPYSKFREKYGLIDLTGQVSGSTGMTTLYGVPMLILIAIAAASLGAGLTVPLVGPPVELTTSGAIGLTMLILHFIKRVYESQFVHRYSAGMSNATCIGLTAAYMFLSISQVPEVFHPTTSPGSLQIAIGCIAWVAGVFGNGYHHKLLADLRKDGTGLYSIPTGGLFEFIVCPHYLCELIGWAGYATVVNSLPSWGMVIFMSLMLGGRSNAVLKWYSEKFDEKDLGSRKRILPYVY